MSDFKAKMHKIRFPLGLDPPQTPLGVTTLSQIPQLHLRGLASKRREGEEGEGKTEGGKRRKTEGRGRKGREREGPAHKNILT